LTQFVISISNVLKSDILFILPAMGLAVYGWFFFLKTKPGREFWDRTRIRLPIFGGIAHKICLARFTRTLASLIRSGVPILEVLQIVSNTVGNVVMEKAIRTAASDIERGEGISAALGGLTSLIEPLLIVFLGITVGGIAICMFLPIFKMAEIINPQNR